MVFERAHCSPFSKSVSRFRCSKKENGKTKEKRVALSLQMEDLHKAKVSEEGRIISGLYGHFFFFFVIIFASSRLTWGVSRHEEGVVISSTIRFYSFLWKSVIKNHLCELFYCILVNPSFLFSIKHQSYSNSINIPQRYPLSFIHASYLNPPRTPRFGKQQLLSPQETKKRRNGHPLCPVR